MVKKMLSLFLLVLFACSGYINCIEVCDDYQYYVNPDSNHCRNNPDGERNVTEILKHAPGVTVEEYNIYTEDGYKILLIRAYTNKDKDPVILGHCAFFTTFPFVNRGNKSLAHHLITSGYDLWIINFRGSQYSRGHKTLKASEEKYWQFSNDELALYDLGDSLEFINQKTKKPAILIGHGTANTQGYIYSSSKVDQAKKNLKGIIAVAHIAYIDGTKSYLRFVMPVLDYFKPLINQRWHGELPLSKESKCQSLIEYYIYEIVKMLLYGDDFSEIDPVYLPILRAQNLRKTIGLNPLLHYYQMMKSKKFQAFDYGMAGNQEKYAQPTPPEYNITAIPVPVTLFIGSNDWVSAHSNAERFYIQLREDSRCGLHTVPCAKWNHNDFLEAKDVDIFFNKFLLNSVDMISQGKCFDTLYGEEE